MSNNQYLKTRNYTWSRSGLPQPQDYYQSQFPVLKAGTRLWVSVHCCFHRDTHPSLRINLNSGIFRCFGCGVHGNSIIAFHCQRYDLSFKDAVVALEDRKW